VFDEIDYTKVRFFMILTFSWDYEGSVVERDNHHAHTHVPLFCPPRLQPPAEFMQWISGLPNQSCHVVSTHFRPFPLQILVFSIAVKKPLQVMNHKRVFNVCEMHVRSYFPQIIFLLL
jgi:hypothetical protein